MRTSKYLSTISYNSDNFLQSVLNSLIENKSIVFWAYIEHFPEKNELKKHKHLFIQPNGLLNTDCIIDKFIEEVPHDKPLNVMPFRVSKIDDCLLYFLHDTHYLIKKFLKKKYTYDLLDFHTSNFDYLRELYNSVDMSTYSVVERLCDFACEGVPFDVLCKRGFIPINQLLNYKRFYDILLYDNISVSTTEKDNVLFPVQNKFNF